jgi:hypothetical protein
MSYLDDLVGTLVQVADAVGAIAQRARWRTWLFVNGPLVIEDAANKRLKLDFSNIALIPEGESDVIDEQTVAAAEPATVVYSYLPVADGVYTISALVKTQYLTTAGVFHVTGTYIRTAGFVTAIVASDRVVEHVNIPGIEVDWSTDGASIHLSLTPETDNDTTIEGLVRLSKWL